jgi:hypothetical protein
MNKDLAGVSAIWRALPEVRDRHFLLLIVYFASTFQRAPKMVLRRMLGPSLETGTVFDIALSGNYCAICDCVSVMAAREKCDDKGLKAAFGHRSLTESAVVQGPFSKSARRGAPPARVRGVYSPLGQLDGQHSSQGSNPFPKS